MKCPKCGSEAWVYVDDPCEVVLRESDSGDAIQVDFPCYCPYCDGAFFRRDVFVHSGEKTEWIFNGDFIKESE